MTLTAMLMAGGLSSRMGTDKSLVTISGQPLWQRQLDVLQQVRPNKLWVSARSRPAWLPEALEIVFDAPPSRGPLSGLAPALAQLETSHLLVLAIDLPAITPALLRHLLSLSRPHVGVVPVSDNRYEPLCAVYPREAAATAAKALAQGDLSLQHLISKLELAGYMTRYSLSNSEQPMFRNVNTPADLTGLV
jgi:molybdenum cofactor guanylyltransferase